MFKCDVCEKVFKEKRYLSRHGKYAHGEQDFKCEKCNKKKRYNQKVGNIF